MDSIRLREIDFSTFQRLQQQGTTATIYRRDDLCLKMLTGMTGEEKDNIYLKFLDMEGLKIDGVILPKGLIMENGRLQGYYMDYFDNSKCLSDEFGVKYVDSKRLLDCATSASKILRKIHENDIICQDLSFENILVDINNNVMFCDLDGCQYKNHSAPFISLLLKNFFIDYRREQITISKNLDRISMLLSFYYLMYEEELQNISRRQYDKLSSKINTLEILKEYANMLVNTSKQIGEMPYLDEVIDSSDTCVFDREKQLRLIHRIFGRI